MPCDYVSPEQTEAQRQREIDEALADLMAQVQAGSVRIEIGPDGAVCFADWGEERNGVTDVCAFTRLQAENSWEWQQALMTAEAAAGRSINTKAIAAGVHSHDGGKTWGTH